MITINEKAKNICIQQFNSIEEFENWKNQNPNYIIHSIEPIIVKQNIYFITIYRKINSI